MFLVMNIGFLLICVVFVVLLKKFRNFNVLDVLLRVFVYRIFFKFVKKLRVMLGDFKCFFNLMYLELIGECLYFLL